MRYYWNEELVSRSVKLSGWLGMSLSLFFLVVYYFYGELYWLGFVAIPGLAILRFSNSAHHYIADNIGSYIELENDGFYLVKPVINYEIKLSWSEVESVKFLGSGLHRFCLYLTGNRYQSFYHFKQPKQLLLAINTNLSGRSKNAL